MTLFLVWFGCLAEADGRRLRLVRGGRAEPLGRASGRPAGGPDTRVNYFSQTRITFREVHQDENYSEKCNSRRFCQRKCNSHNTPTRIRGNLDENCHFLSSN